MNYQAQIYTTSPCYQALVGDVHKALTKYGIPFEEDVNEDVHTIKQCGEPLRKTRTAKLKASAPVDFECENMGDGYYVWKSLKTGQLIVCTFPYDPQRQVKIAAESKARIEKRLAGPCVDSLGKKTSVKLPLKGEL